MRPLLASVTTSAQKKIQDIKQKYKDQAGIDTIPAIAWLDKKLNPIISSSNVCIGLYHESSRDEIADGICVIDGLECLVSVTEEDAFLFDGKTLDYDEGWILR